MAYNVNRLYKIHETFYFRVKIPLDLLRFFGGKTDVKRSLRTRSLTQARRLLRLWDSKTEEVFTTMRLGMLTDAQIKQLADDYLRISLRTDEYCRANRLLPLTEEQRNSELQRLSRCLQETRDALTLGGTRRADKELHTLFLQEKFPDLSTNDPEYIALERELLKQDLEICRVEIERTKGNYANGYDDRVQVPPVSPIPPPAVPSPPENKGPSLSDAIDKYIADYRQSGKAAQNAIDEYESSCNLLKELLNDKEINAVTRDDIRSFRDTLQKLPKHIRKKPKYRGKPLLEILEVATRDGDELIGDVTIKKYLDRVSNLMVWAVREGLRKDNPVEGLKPVKKKDRKPSEERKAFDKEDLTRLVKGLVTVAGKGELDGHPERFWIPLIGLYSGMRVNEICQLHIEDIAEDKETGIWFFNVEALEGDAKSLKTVTSRRRVPVHPILIELGFLRYYQKIKADDSPRVWMNLTKTSRGYHRRFANWFLGSKAGGRIFCASFLRDYVTTDPLKNFHSFRHTFINDLKQKLVDERVVDELVGHSHGSLALDRYGKGYALQTLLDAMLKLTYSVDLTPLQAVIEAVKPEK
ncbi:MAG: Integrase family [Geobacteraceae bacterium]|nr:MAG: Integrase family [Geobacteraceae bacterium]